LKVGDVDLKSGKVQVKHGAGGGAKGGKGRTVFLGKSARQAVWRYLAKRDDGEDQEAPLFLGKFNRPMNKDVLLKLITRLGAEGAGGEMPSASLSAHICHYLPAVGRRCVHPASAARAQHARDGTALRPRRAG
jgi:site-specific recombinase XerC